MDSFKRRKEHPFIKSTEVSHSRHRDGHCADQSCGGRGLPDILGIQLGMPAREAHAKLQGQFPKNNLQVMSTNLPTIEKPVISSFQSAPKQTSRWAMRPIL